MNWTLLSEHKWINRLTTLALVTALLGLLALAAYIVFGATIAVLTLAAAAGVATCVPIAGAHWVMRLYRARPVAFHEAPEAQDMIGALAKRAGLPTTPRLFLLPQRAMNAFATGSGRETGIAITHDLYRQLSPRELQGVLAHEVSHLAHDDMRLLSAANVLGSMTRFLAMAGHWMMLITFPFALLAGYVNGVFMLGWLLLVTLPILTTMTQLALSRSREFQADTTAAQLTEDPLALAAALQKIDNAHRPWWHVLFGMAKGNVFKGLDWLRTHPSTAERVARLRTMSTGQPHKANHHAHTQHTQSHARTYRPRRSSPVQRVHVIRIPAEEVPGHARIYNAGPRFEQARHTRPRSNHRTRFTIWAS